MIFTEKRMLKFKRQIAVFSIVISVMSFGFSAVSAQATVSLQSSKTGFRFLKKKKVVYLGSNFTLPLWYKFRGNNYARVKIKNKKVIIFNELSYEDIASHSRRAYLYLTAKRRGQSMIIAKCDGKTTKCRIVVR